MNHKIFCSLPISSRLNVWWNVILWTKILGAVFHWRWWICHCIHRWTRKIRSLPWVKEGLNNKWVVIFYFNTQIDLYKLTIHLQKDYKLFDSFLKLLRKTQQYKTQSFAYWVTKIFALGSSLNMEYTIAFLHYYWYPESIEWINQTSVRLLTLD